MLRASMYMRASMRASMSASGRLQGSDIRCVSSESMRLYGTSIISGVGGVYMGVASELSTGLQNGRRDNAI